MFNFEKLQKNELNIITSMYDYEFDRLIEDNFNKFGEVENFFTIKFSSDNGSEIMITTCDSLENRIKPILLKYKLERDMQNKTKTKNKKVKI